LIEECARFLWDALLAKLCTFEHIFFRKLEKKTGFIPEVYISLMFKEAIDLFDGLISYVIMFLPISSFQNRDMMF
jgi:hypothetical protein